MPALPGGLTYVEIAAGGHHTVARRSDGSVVAWGCNNYGQCNVPALPAGSPTSRSRRAAITRWRVTVSPRGRVRRHGLRWCGNAGLRLQSPRASGRRHVLADAGNSERLGVHLLQRGIPAASSALGSGCTLALDLATSAPLIPVVADPTGAWALTLFVPSDPNLVGVQVALQIALFATAGPFGLDLSNGLIVTVGY